jgi:hypothetical protein
MIKEVPKLMLAQKIASVDAWIESHDDSHELHQVAVKASNVFSQKLARLQTVETHEHGSWLSYYHLFRSPFTFSGSIMNLDHCKEILESVVRIDRLPKANSLQALHTLQDAWDNVEVYHKVADSYKRITKASYIVLLVTGLVTTTVAQLSDEGDAAENIYPFIILAMSLVCSGAAAYVSFMNPAQRWQQLRGAALAIESEIWMFRTRSGSYRAHQSELGSKSDRLIHKNISAIQARVLEGADIKSTAFFGTRKSLNQHGQHPHGARGFGYSDQQKLLAVKSVEMTNTKQFTQKKDGSQHAVSEVTFSELEEEIRRKVTLGPRTDSSQKNVDLHYAPLQPDLFVKYRLETCLSFYSDRIPAYNSSRKAGQTILVAGSMVSVVLVTLRIARWAAVVSIVTSSVTAWLEFNGTSSKINRYSAAVDGLTSLAVWWRTLDIIDKSVIENIDRLVLTCESIVSSEKDAWASTAARATAKLLNEAAANNQKGRDV